MRALAFGFAAAVLAAPAAAGMRQPSPDLTPREVVTIQVQALKTNDTPKPDAGIARTWAFAHPRNKAQTGPLPRFAAMIKSPRYNALLDHARHKITRLARGEGTAVFAVRVTAAGGEVVRYRWRVAKVAEGEHAGAWMTAMVSAPQDAGDAI